jgi:hypothetical protein
MRSTVKRILASDLLDWVIRLLVVVSVILGVSTSLSQRALTLCVVRWGNDLNDTLTSRQQSNAARLRALNQLAQDTAADKPQALLDADAAELRRIQAQYDEILNKHPYPPPPKLIC